MQSIGKKHKKPASRQQRVHITTLAWHAAPCATQVSPARLTALIKEQTSLADLQGLLSQHDSMLNVFHVTAALQWLVAHPQEQPESSEQLAALVQQWLTPVTVDQLTARDCANLAYYCSKLGYVEGAPDPVRVYKDLLQRFMVVKGDAVPQAVSNLLYALGSQEQLRGVLKQDTLVTLLQQLNQVAGRATPQNLSNALWAAAKVKPQDSQQLEDVVAQLLNKFINNTGNAKPQEVSNVLYALALLPRTWPMDSAPELVERLVQLLPEAQPQHMSNVLWALGQYAEQGWLLNLPKQSMARVMAAATEILTQLSPGATQGRPGGSRPVVNGQDLSNACWGVAKLQQLGDAPPGQQHQPWQEPFSSAVQALVRLLSSAEPQHVANVLWSCAVVRHYPQQLLHDVVAALPKVQQANTQEVANMAWALAVLAPDPPPAALTVSLLQRMQALLAQQPAAVNSQDLANTAWAVAVLDQQQLAGQLAPLAAAAFSQQQWPTSQAEALRQWQQVHLWLMDTQVLGPAGLGAVPGVTQQQLEQCQAAWEEQLTREAKASEVQKEVAKVSTQPSGLLLVLYSVNACAGWAMLFFADDVHAWLHHGPHQYTCNRFCPLSPHTPGAVQHAGCDGSGPGAAGPARRQPQHRHCGGFQGPAAGGGGGRAHPLHLAGAAPHWAYSGAQQGAAAAQLPGGGCAS
jgi:hypothetical protein